MDYFLDFIDVITGKIFFVLDIHFLVFTSLFILLSICDKSLLSVLLILSIKESAGGCFEGYI